MKAAWQGRIAAINTRAGEYAPMAPACCNACRACTTTNIVTLVTAAAVGLGALVARQVRRRVGARADQLET